MIFSFVFLEKQIGNILSVLVFTLAFLTALVIFMRSALAPRQDLISFIEDYAQGKLSFHSHKRDKTSYQGSFRNRYDKQTQYQALNRLKSKITNIFGKKPSPGVPLIEKQAVKTNERGYSAIPGPIILGDAGLLKTSNKIQKNGYQHLLSGNIPEAGNFLNQLVRRFPLKQVFQNDLGVVYFLTGRMDEAFEHFLKASISGKENSAIIFNLALALKKGKRYKNAFLKFEESLAISETPQCYYHLASLFSITGRFAECARILEKTKNSGLDYHGLIQRDESFKPFLESKYFNNA